MTKKAADPTTTKSPAGNTPVTNATDKSYTVAALGLDLLETTWRITVPVIIFAALGIFADIQLDTKPWMTLAGTVIGFVTAGLLIKRLLRTIQR